MSQILMSSPDVGDLEEQAVVAAVRSGWIAPLGPDVDRFESELAAYAGVDHAVALSSGTAALHLGLLGIGVKPKDVVVTATLTFAATANAIVYTGAEPYFVDCTPQTGNLSPELLRRSLDQLFRAGERVGAIVPVDLLGKLADYAKILDIAAEFGVPVLADAAESLGASQPSGSAGSFGAAAAVSFNGNKVMTTSGGGALLSNNATIVERARYLSTQARQPVVHYEHTDIGYNYRMSNILAALGRAQLSRLDAMIVRRREMRALYTELFSSIPGVEIFGSSAEEGDNAWLTSIIVDAAVAGWTPQDLAAALRAHNIESRPLWKPMHLQPVFKCARGEIDGTSEKLFLTGLTLPSGSALGDVERARITDVICDFLRNLR